ncbi:hypothetical protein L226DRAFT_541075 [Lentinus tigrinus ALCF2SS1-7]|uniref:uncharacterized protein n=1 Tax=Lentinus tigrinus ALCF2SS1-7 TaxID=1328758 RepID=UPI00116618DF|nr:hypothetical protein L226DRAFT_541075 [Lentinus tigrinus ALCF2SS1-7]
MLFPGSGMRFLHTTFVLLGFTVALSVASTTATSVVEAHGVPFRQGLYGRRLS